VGGHEPLAEKFLHLFVLFEKQNCKVAKMGFMGGSSWEWAFVWRRNFQDWEVELVSAFLAELNNYSIRPSEKDRWMWVAGSDNRYTVSGAYAWLYEAVVGSSEEEIFKRVWKVKVSNKVGHLVWRLVRDRLPSGRNLGKLP